MGNSSIAETIEKLRQLTQINVMENWRCCYEDLPTIVAQQSEIWHNWDKIALNSKGHIAWESGKTILWLGQILVIPESLRGYPLVGLSLRLLLSWWAEYTQIFVNGKLVQEGDLFDSSTRILLSPAVTPGAEILVALRLVSPGHDHGALIRSLALYEHLDSNIISPGFFADELSILQIYAHTSPSDSPSALENLESQIRLIDWESLPNRVKFTESLQTLRQNLASLIAKPQAKISLLGHAHLDMAWLWAVSETWETAQRTFESVLQLQTDFPELIFCHSTPALYDWMEQHRPDLFAAIQTQVALGRWEIVGAMWVEPDINLLNGESIIRQLFYGQRYIEKKFNQLSSVEWLPDTFGFCGQLPQILKQAGIEYFVTQKLRWNDTTKFPYGAFWWQSPEGTKIFSLMSALIGTAIEPIPMVNYSLEWQNQTGLNNALWLPGVGDHGGGPTRDMLEISRCWQKSPFFPLLEFTTAINYLQHIREQQSSIPIWNDELYLEFHRGCYTTHADQKRYNRYSEGLLYQAELLATLAHIITGVSYPHADLEQAWKKTLFNQFHDILPGTSIPQVFLDANQVWQEVIHSTTTILDHSLQAIATHIQLPKPPQPKALPIIVFNQLNWQRSEVVEFSLNTLPSSAAEKVTVGADISWQIYDITGKPLPSQKTADSKLVFLAADIPSIGYKVFWLCPQKSENQNADSTSQDAYLKKTREGHNIKSTLVHHSGFVNKKNYPLHSWILENQVIRVIVNDKTGDLASIFDKINHREILDLAGGNQLQAFQDQGQYWDAWNIDPKYAEYPLAPTQLKSIQWVEWGEIRQIIRVVRIFGASEFCQDYILVEDSPLLKISTRVDWQENHVLIKAAFPLTLNADYVTYEMACGAIQRPTQSENPAAQAKWEVPALRWADLTATMSIDEEMTKREDNQNLSDFPFPIPYGVSLLNDCKYGYDAQISQLRITLLRSPTWPDPNADKGWHEFTYAIYPHLGGWQQSHTVRRGYELNLPLQVRFFSQFHIGEDKLLPSVGSFLDLSGENLILMAFKPSEDDSQTWILRFYESHGEKAELHLKSDLNLKIIQEVDLLERSQLKSEVLSESEMLNISPWQIKSFKVIVK